MARFQPPPIQGTKFLEGDEPSYAWQKWFELVQFALSTNPAPAAANSSGTFGQLATDGNFLYVCIAKNSWKRVAIAAW